MVVFYIIYEKGTRNETGVKRLVKFAAEYEARGVKSKMILAGSPRHIRLQCEALLARAFGKWRKRTYLPELLVGVDGKMIWGAGSPSPRQLAYLKAHYLDHMSWPPPGVGREAGEESESLTSRLS